MTYWNPIEQYGVDAFARDLAAAGATGMITPDLIPDEAAEWIAASDEHRIDRTFLVSPSSTDERLAMTVGALPRLRLRHRADGRHRRPDAGRRRPRRTWSPGSGTVDPDMPVGVGLGVGNGAQAAEVAAFADGVIVGSALVRCVLDAPDRATGLAPAARAERRTRRGCAQPAKQTAPDGCRVPARRDGSVCTREPRRYPQPHDVGVARARAARPGVRALHRRWASSWPCWSSSTGCAAAAWRPWASLDMAVWAVPFGIVGARIYHVITSPQGLLRRRRRPDPGLLHLGGRPRHLGRGRRRRARRLARRPPARPAAERLRRRARPRRCRWPRRSAGSATGSTTSCTAASPPCRGACGCTTWTGANPGHATVIDGKPVTLPGLYHPTFLYEAIWNVGVAGAGAGCSTAGSSSAGAGRSRST